MTDAEKLKAIAAIYDTKTEKFVDGFRVTESTHAGHNLDGAIIDIDHQGGRCDAVSRKTLGRVRDQLAEIGNILKIDENF